MSQRREFLKGVGTITAGTVAGWPVTARAAAAAGRHRYAMVVDLRKCIGCQACTVACAYENQLPASGWRTVVTVREVKSDKAVGAAMLPALCNHCDAPACVPVCPMQATYKTADGSVQIDADKCIGCGLCAQACPYQARFINETTGKADKCSFCLHRVQGGLLPACVETCVGGARLFGDLADPGSAVGKLVASGRAQVLKPEAGTHPNVYYIGLDEVLAARGRDLLADPRTVNA